MKNLVKTAVLLFAVALFCCVVSVHDAGATAAEVAPWDITTITNVVKSNTPESVPSHTTTVTATVHIDTMGPNTYL